VFLSPRACALGIEFVHFPARLLRGGSREGHSFLSGMTLVYEVDNLSALVKPRLLFSLRQIRQAVGIFLRRVHQPGPSPGFGRCTRHTEAQKNEANFPTSSKPRVLNSLAQAKILKLALNWVRFLYVFYSLLFTSSRMGDFWTFISLLVASALWVQRF
jgi:hypothetical protein